MSESGFVATYCAALALAEEVEKIRLCVRRGRWVARIRIRGRGWATHDIPLSIVRGGTAEQGAEVAQEVLQELRCRGQ